MGNYKKSQDCHSQAVSLLKHMRSSFTWLNLCKIALTRAKFMTNEKDIDLESLYRYAAENNWKKFDGLKPRYIGEILMNIDDQHIPEAENWIKKAIGADERNGMMWNLGRDYALYAELFKRKGDQSKARENLNKAIKIMKECGADGWIEKYEKELASL